ncbi:MAG: DUF2059 domain-containing protein [Deltaproteobacteria bacterium]|nr:DUF2059 domain-containing protein [Deltaproteobacteria bacterium]
MHRLLLVFITFTACATSTPSLDSHREAAAEFLELMQVEQTMTNMSGLMADAMVKQNPKMAPYRDVVIAWSNETMSWSTHRDAFVELYVDALSEGELRDLIAFYRSPSGQKSIRVMPELMNRGAEIGNKAATANMGKLQSMIRARAAELEAESEGSPTP